MTQPLEIALVAMSIYLFILALKSEKNYLYFLSGALLAIGFYVRRSASVILVVEIMVITLFYYLKYFRIKPKNLLLLSSGFITIFLIVSLYFSYITDSNFIVEYLHLRYLTASYRWGTMTDNLRFIFNDLIDKIFYIALPTFLFLSSIQVNVSNTFNSVYKILFLSLCFFLAGIITGFPIYIIFIGLFTLILIILLILNNKIILYKISKVFDGISYKYETDRLRYFYKLTLTITCLIPFLMLTVNFTYRVPQLSFL